MGYRCGSCIERFVDDRIMRTLRGPRNKSAIFQIRLAFVCVMVPVVPSS